MRSGAASALFQLLLLASALPAYSIQGHDGAVSGIVRDSSGNPVEGAQVILTCLQSTSSRQQTISGRGGAYRIGQPTGGDCRVAAEKEGYREAGKALPSPSSSQTVDLILEPLAAKADASSATTVGGEHAPPQFQAAGIRGLIDPGGYSASVTAGAASTLLQGMADIKRPSNAAGGAASREYCRTEQELRAVVGASPNSALAHLHLGEHYLAHGYPDRAASEFARAHQLNPSNPAISLRLADALVGDREFARALTILDHLSEHGARFHFSRALALEGLGRFLEASREYQAAAAEEPSAQSYFGEGYELILAGQPAQAVTVFAAASARYPDSTLLLIGAGVAEFLAGDTGRASSILLQAVALNARDPRPYPFLSATYDATRPDSAAIRAAFAHYLSIEPDSAEANYLAACQILRNASNQDADPAKARTLLVKAITLQPSFSGAHFELGKLDAAQGDYSQAVAEFSAASKLDPHVYAADYQLALAYSHLKNKAAAEREMERFREGAGLVHGADNDIDLARYLSVLSPQNHDSGAIPPTCPSSPGQQR